MHGMFTPTGEHRHRTLRHVRHVQGSSDHRHLHDSSVDLRDRSWGITKAAAIRSIPTEAVAQVRSVTLS
jgi:hypothetical protein